MSARIVIPVSTGEIVEKGCEFEITVCPTEDVRLKHLVISNAGTTGGAADWNINAISVDGQSVFPEAMPIPGERFMFANDNNLPVSPVAFEALDPIKKGTPIIVTVLYKGSKPTCVTGAGKGCPFFGAFIGTPVSFVG